MVEKVYIILALGRQRQRHYEFEANFKDIEDPVWKKTRQSYLQQKHGKWFLTSPWAFCLQFEVARRPHTSWQRTNMQITRKGTLCVRLWVHLDATVKFLSWVLYFREHPPGLHFALLQLLWHLPGQLLVSSRVWAGPLVSQYPTQPSSPGFTGAKGNTHENPRQGKLGRMNILVTWFNIIFILRYEICQDKNCTDTCSVLNLNYHPSLCTDMRSVLDLNYIFPFLVTCAVSRGFL